MARDPLKLTEKQGDILRCWNGYPPTQEFQERTLYIWTRCGYRRLYGLVNRGFLRVRLNRRGEHVYALGPMCDALREREGSEA